jgi:PAS domain S-box-containing protein
MTGKDSSDTGARDALVCVLTVQVLFALSAGAALILDPAGILDDLRLQVLAGSVILLLVVMACLLALRFHHRHSAEGARSRSSAQLMDTVLTTSREWLWAVDEQGKFTFSSPTSTGLLGWTPAELIAEHCSKVIELNDLLRAEGDLAAINGPGWNRVVARFLHRDGSLVWMEVSGTTRPAKQGQRGGFEGTSRLIPPESVQQAAAAHSWARVRAMIDEKHLVTAFQPIHNLATGRLLGVEALSRFVATDGASTSSWFADAADVGLGTELEFAALETALETAKALQPDIYVALNVTPATCLDPLLPQILSKSTLALDRIVLELTERLEVAEYGPLIAALAPLRQRGVRIAVDDAGSGFASMRHVLHIRPDIIKLDRSLIAGIDDDQGQRALGAALFEFARRIGATLVAEGIETQSELAAITRIGMTVGQGYLLGRPSVRPKDWAAWSRAPWLLTEPT